jgi:hypothetical protein
MRTQNVVNYQEYFLAIRKGTMHEKVRVIITLNDKLGPN